MLVTREAIMSTVWPGVFVSDDNIAQCVKEIRRAPGDIDQTIVKTVPKRGFRFEATVQDQPKIPNADMPIGKPPPYKDDEPVPAVLRAIGQARRGLHLRPAGKRALRADDLTTLQYEPRVIVTDKLRSYGVAQRQLLPGVEHRQADI
jgi:hypothetical protein